MGPMKHRVTEILDFGLIPMLLGTWMNIQILAQVQLFNSKVHSASFSYVFERSV